MSARPYGLTEEDQFRLYQTRHTLRLLQFFAEADNQGPMEPELLASAFWILGEQLDQVLASADQQPVARARK